ncbi:hypothetical protein E2C01_039244 [Portunus trituberculatus]|uniref:Uncharacterized protein n=1 Tax=Portunus trituberculatus TaxID=210409 RepID=A0A5B7FGC6_PORTR|nr:hypothetical protein [Portunus trituberculatus]
MDHLPASAWREILRGTHTQTHTRDLYVAEITSAHCFWAPLTLTPLHTQHLSCLSSSVPAASLSRVATYHNSMRPVLAKGEAFTTSHIRGS